MSVTFIPEAFPFGALLRSAWPAKALTADGFPCSLEKPNEASTVVLHHALDHDLDKTVKGLQDSGKFVILQQDDNIFKIPPQSVVSVPREVLVATKEAAKRADRMIVTTHALKDFYTRWNPDVRLVRNYLPRWVFELKPRRRINRSARPQIVYPGALKGHSHDMEWLRPVLGEITAKCDLWIIGEPEWKDYLAPIPVKTLHWRRWPRNYYRLLSRFDAGIVPLLPCEFNEAKSWLKMLDLSSQGVTPFGSDRIENRKLGLGFIDDTPEHLALSLQTFRMSRDVGLKQATAWNFALENHLDEWKEALTVEASGV